MPEDTIPQPPEAVSQNQARLTAPAGETTLDIQMELPPGAAVTVTLHVHSSADGTLLEQRQLQFSNPPGQAAALPPARGTHWSALTAALAHEPAALAAWLTTAALALYLITRLVGLSDFPLYFFTDEAIQTNLAADLVRDGFQSYDDELLPTFFENGNQYNLSTSVYAQVLPYMLFGKSIWVTRATAVLLTLLAALAVAGILRDAYRSPHPWMAVLLLSVTPAWFLHSRTAFETALAVSFYAAFLYAYCMYRCVNPRWLYAAITLGALAFYTYSPAQMVMLVTALLLLAFDAPYHWRHRALLLRGLGLALLLALPYVRFLIAHPGENLRHLQILDSYWIKNMPLDDKLAIFGKEYLRGLDPRYWFLPNDVDYSRHVMKDYGHLPRWGLPLVLLGLALALKGVRQPPNRVLLAALVAAPAGAALAALGITRALFMVIPAALLAALSLSALLEWLRARLCMKTGGAALAVFAVLALWNVGMLNDALHNGPTWFNDYGMGGVQFGAKQLQASITAHLRQHPADRFIISPDWTNGANEVKRFFFADDAPVQLGGITEYLEQRMPFDLNTVFVLMPEELERVAGSGKFSQIRLERILPYPDGRPGFYFVRLEYAPNFDAIVAAEKHARRALEETVVRWDDAQAAVRYSALDMGQIQDAFDGDVFSILRTREANPLFLDILPEIPRRLQSLAVRVGGVPTRVSARLTLPGESEPLVLIQSVGESPEPRFVTFTLREPVQAARITLEVLSLNDAAPAHVHVWEVRAR